jgi:hypothetical protein
VEWLLPYNTLINTGDFMETLWDTIHRDLTRMGAFSDYKVDSIELANHLDQLYGNIEELKIQISQLKEELKSEIRQLKDE